MKTIKILHLYPNLMNLYGDYANVLVLKRHLLDQGYKVKVDTKDINDTLSFASYNFVYMGSGTESNLMVALKHLSKYKKELKKYINDDKVLLFTGNAMELLGESIDSKKTLGILNFETKIVSKRYTGDVIFHNDELGEIVGFINKSSLITGGDNVALFTYMFKDNNLKDNTYEGYRIKNCFGTHVLGPVLVKNPSFMKYIVKLLIDSEYKDIQYDFEENSYNITLNALKGRK